jgi:hypothetical protein
MLTRYPSDEGAALRRNTFLGGGMPRAAAVENEATRIADAIVGLVERTDGPVTLAQIQREIAGFAAETAPMWEYVIEHGAKEVVIWDGMTGAGLAALMKVMSGRRVAVQLVSEWPYLLEDLLLDQPHWQPVVLLPAKAANLDTARWLMRTTMAGRDRLLGTARTKRKRRYLPLNPGAVRFDADQFSM